MPFRIALSGLHSAQADLKVTGNNIANSQTVGFKSSRAEFVDVYAAAYGSISNVTNGNGARTSTIRQLFSQGNIEYTDNSTDLAITGQGFFVVEDDKGRYLTRNGQFGIDRDGNVVNSQGQRLQVYPTVKVGTDTTFNTGTLTDLKLKNAVGSPVATSKLDISLNIDANQSQFDVSTSGLAAGQKVYDHSAGAIPFNKDDPSTFNHVTATTVYDSLGSSHVAQFYYRKVDDTGTGANANTWQVITYIDGTEVPPASDGTAGGPAEAAPANSTVLQFNDDGTLQDATYSTQGTSPVPATFKVAFSGYTPASGAAPVNIDIDFSEITQYGSDFAVNNLTQNGFATGRLSGFDVGDNGIVYARYTNGNAEILGMVSVANVANPQGLRQKGDNLWVETFDAGDTTLGQPGTASLGLIQSGALESSTVEIADQLVNMIVAQRNYQASAQVISTADQLTQTLLNIR
ncbi:MAG: flagellar hook protein FlgE [Gammaproteobacteria bacterium]|nr:flagellar hook protein FlgE [Gammaproteobacteria bacterium]